MVDELMSGLAYVTVVKWISRNIFDVGTRIEKLLKRQKAEDVETENVCVIQVLQ